MKRKTYAQLQDEVHKLSHDPIWGCYTRAACELFWDEFKQGATSIVYTDIDDMHGLNSLYGHDGTDTRIREVVNSLRHGERGEDIVASRWLNGDELVFILKSGDAKQFCERLQRDFGEKGIKLTMAYTRRIKANIFDTINPLDEQVNQYKKYDLRGEIIPCNG